MINMKHAYTSNTYTLLHFTKHFDPSVLSPKHKKRSKPQVVYSKPPVRSSKVYFQHLSEPPIKKKKDVLGMTIRRNSSFTELFVKSESH